jgi:hypothetical protein
MESRKAHLKLTNDSYVILLRFKNSSESYYREQAGWVKVSTRGRKFRATAEQVLNHLLPALAMVKPNVTVEVVYRPIAEAGEDSSSR